MSGSLCVDDLVAQKNNSSFLGLVERTNSDVETHIPFPDLSGGETITCDKDIPPASFRGFRRDGIPPEGTVVVRWQHLLDPQLTLESKLDVVDRSFLIGDVVKRDARDAMSGVVINTSTRCVLEPMCDWMIRDDGHGNSTFAHLKGVPYPPGVTTTYQKSYLHRPPPLLDVPAAELNLVEVLTQFLTPELLVVYKDWIGRVDEVTNVLVVRLSDNGVVEVQEDEVERLNGTVDNYGVGDIVVTRKAVLRLGTWIYGKYNPNNLPVGTVVRTRTVSADIGWLERRIWGSDDADEPPSTLERNELDSDDFHIYDRTKRPRRKESDSESHLVSNSEIDAQLGLLVRFKDLAGACVKYDGQNGKGRLERIDRKDTLGYDLNVFSINKFQTDVIVQWQDLTVTRERSIDLVPEIAIDDEHNVWPGEIAHLLDLQPVAGLPGTYQAGKVGIIQSVNAAERMARIRWCPEACVQYSMEKWEPDDDEPRSIVTGLVGLAAGEPEDVSLYDIEAPAELNVRRGDIVLVTNPQLRSTGSSDGINDRNWLGELVNTQPDGSLTIRLGAANSVRDVNLRREDILVAIRSDGTDDYEWQEEDFSDHMDIDSRDGIALSDVSEDEFDAFVNENLASGYGTDHDLDGHDVRYEDENGAPLDEADVEDEDWESASGSDEDVEMQDSLEETPSTSLPVTLRLDAAKLRDIVGITSSEEATSNEVPDAYAVLSESVPMDHHFFGSIKNTAHMKRTTKEHQILSTASNLPKGVYVRTWESRLDLLRVLFIGPADTPYAKAPFVMDMHLPYTFPTEPPEVFFYSWRDPNGLGGVGRVNPNLYEDGKICLSLLGTWESGGKGSSAGWDASRSTLLQVIVSLLGLVLVKEPYFNEAGYEPLAGLESSRRASELYSERVYLKARTFIIAALRALKIEGNERIPGVGGLEGVLHWLYKSSDGPKLLDQNISDGEAILSRSDTAESERLDQDRDLAMSKGARIALRKILDRLKEL